MKKLTIRDIAKLSGFSTATVSRVINNRPGVTEDVRDHIQEIIRQNNFHLNRTARNLVKKDQSSFLFICDNQPDNPFFEELMRGAVDAAEESYLNLQFNSLSNKVIVNYFLKLLDKQQIDGVVLVAGTIDAYMEQLVQYMRDRALPLVVFDSPVGMDEIPCVHSNDASAVNRAMEYLFSCGHTKIAHIGGRSVSLSGYSRRQGYMLSMERHGRQEYAKDMCLMNNVTHEDAYEAMKTLLSREDPPTAVVVYNDLMTTGVYQAVRECGLRIPEDISVIGMDDAPQTEVQDPPLTTIHQPIYEIGQSLVRLIKEVSDQDYEGAISSKIFVAPLVIRDSVRDLTINTAG